MTVSILSVSVLKKTRSAGEVEYSTSSKQEVRLKGNSRSSIQSSL